jgi:CHAT domain-containing protein
MRWTKFILIGILIGKLTFLFGQCLPSDSLWKRIIQIADSKISREKELKALLSLEQAEANCPQRNDSSHAFLLRRIGVMYNGQADYLKAVQYFKSSIAMIMTHADQPAVNVKELVTNYYWLSVLYDSLNNVNRKMKAWDSCEYYAKKLHDELDISYIRTLCAKVEYYFDVGDYLNCINYAGRCKTLATRYAQNAKNSGYIVAGERLAEISLLWNVNALSVLKNFDSAEKLLTNKLQEYRNTNLKGYMGFVYGRLAEIQENRGNYIKALDLFQKALGCYREDQDLLNCKAILKQIGYDIYFSHLHDDDQALLYYRAALNNVNTDNPNDRENTVESLNIMADIGNVFVHKGFYDSAFRYFQLAFDQVKPGINEEDILKSPLDEINKIKKIYYLSGLILDKADARKQEFQTSKQMDHLREAIRIYKVGDQFLDRIKLEQSDLDSKLFWRKDTRRLYEHAIEACKEYGDTTDAFYFFERSRASLLYDQLNEQRWLDEDDISKLTQIKKQIIQLGMQLDKLDRSSDRYEDIRTERFNKQQDLESLTQYIKSQNPLYYQSFLDNSDIVIQFVQKNLLKDHQALVELFDGDSANYSLVITPEHTTIRRINKAAFDSSVSLFMNFISNPDLLNRKFNSFAAISRHLYQLIFQNNPLPAGRIIFSPGGRYFPIEALVTSNPSEADNYFLNDHPVSYTYSARYLMNDFIKNAGEGSNDFMGVAPVQYQTASYSLATLSGSDRSIIQIGSNFNGAHNLLGSQASKSNFLQQFSRYKIIQLYTHSADSSDRGEPLIYFADSALYLSELIPQNSPITQLIVLSACETGLGRDYKGEGIFSFNRGFAALGIPAAITDLWSVDDESTYQLTEYFYKYLSDGMPTDIALQKAKLEFVRNSSTRGQLPYYWAAAILAGKTDTIHFRKDNPWKNIGFLSASVCLSFFLIWFWRKRKKLSPP